MKAGLDRFMPKSQVIGSQALSLPRASGGCRGCGGQPTKPAGYLVEAPTRRNELRSTRIQDSCDTTSVSAVVTASDGQKPRRRSRSRASSALRQHDRAP